MNNVDTAFFVSGMAKALEKNIKKSIKDDFKEIHLSGNLAKTTWSEEVVRLHASSFWDRDFSKGKKVAMVHIPAVRYDLSKYAKERVIEYQPERGSYAQAVNVTGGFNLMHYHRGYVEDAIIDSIIKSYKSGKYGLGKLSKFKMVSIVIK